MKTGLYIHIPFCPYKCHYCDFLAFSNVDFLQRKYVSYLLKEISLYKGHDLELDSIFIGGGTPSHLEVGLMREIMAAVRETFVVDEDAEISIEMNPNSLDEEKIRTYLELGIKRFSLGVQSFDDEILKILGRGHDKAAVLKDIGDLRRLGAKNISVDMMLANPKQDMAVLDKDIEEVLALGVDHISYYTLILEAKTMFEVLLERGEIDLFDDDLERDMYHRVVNRLAQAGYVRYETSNFAKPGFESRHNKKYWALEDYIGLGLGAASNIGLKRTKNFTKFEDYYKALEAGVLPVEETEDLSLEDREKEFIIMNMRMSDGFLIKDINDRFGIDFLEKYKDVVGKNVKYGLVKVEDGRFMFTDKGMDLQNAFFVEVI